MEISEGLLGPLLLARSTIDRSAVLRQDTAWLERAWAEDRTRVVLVRKGETLVRRHEGGSDLVLLPPGQAPAGQRYLLGVDATNIAYFAVHAELPEISGAEVAGLRQAGALLGDRDAGLLVYAVALEAWHGTHEFCPQCGSRTEITAGGHVRTCPQDGSQHFPRVDPAVIMAVYDDDDRILLARGPQWPEGRMSVLAGFVEPGESLEQAVIREVLEEVGVTVKAPRYLGSQPWPFPRSLMLGFFARAATTELTRDPEEIAEARWFTRAELLAALESGDLRLPPPVSIARRLIETWYGDTLSGDW
ncbi:NTP pyrophosphohydrolase [Acrocarpospora pleiomorpha]|uniref:NAD(+) diphosphatase n=1 Tax=Acrocarpospora pleiomorpha TaxID=90975 RepID=A0A5M3Y2J5_9ACTN|nr:NAD(+) diphosphatase [Acrocarpospora pleiomorpha]GES26419.1 NTP pyrophosphohydrolase [Acrocarpospora pleiomorpha]